MKLLKRQDGFTLAELVVYLGILSVATVVFSSFLVDVIRSNAGTRNARQVQENARFVTSRLAQDARTANDASVTATDIVLTSTTSTVTYHYDAGAGMLTVNGTQLTTPSVRVTTFTPTLTTIDGVKAVTLGVTIQSTTASSPPSPHDSLALTVTNTVRRTLYQ